MFRSNRSVPFATSLITADTASARRSSIVCQRVKWPSIRKWTSVFRAALGMTWRSLALMRTASARRLSTSLAEVALADLLLELVDDVLLVFVDVIDRFLARATLLLDNELPGQFLEIVRGNVIDLILRVGKSAGNLGNIGIGRIRGDDLEFGGVPFRHLKRKNLVRRRGFPEPLGKLLERPVDEQELVSVDPERGEVDPLEGIVPRELVVDPFTVGREILDENLKQPALVRIALQLLPRQGVVDHFSGDDSLVDKRLHESGNPLGRARYAGFPLALNLVRARLPLLSGGDAVVLLRVRWLVRIHGVLKTYEFSALQSRLRES